MNLKALIAALLIPLGVMAGTHQSGTGGGGTWPPTGTPADLLDGDQTGGSAPGSGAANPVDGVTSCAAVNELYINTSTCQMFRCTNSTTDTWVAAGLSTNSACDAAALRTPLFMDVDWDPAAGGTTTAGLREALAQCPVTGKCVIKQRPNTSYLITDAARFLDTGGVAHLCDCVDDDNCTNSSDSANECSDIYIQGAPGSTFGFSGDIPEVTGNWPSLMTWDNITRGGMSGMNIVISDTCNTGDAGVQANDCGCESYGCTSYAILASDNAKDLIFDGNTINISESVDGADNDDYHSWRGFHLGGSTCNEPSQRIKIINNYIAVSADGITAKTSTDGAAECSTFGPIIANNTFSLENKSVGAGEGPTKCELVAMNGYGAVVADNFFDMRKTWSGTPTSPCTAIMAFAETTGAGTDEDVTSGFTITGNQILGIGASSRSWGIRVEGAANGVIASNVLQAGMCSTADQSCHEDGECPGVETCEPTTTYGILFRSNPDNNEAGNRGWIISDNVFGQGANGDGGWNDLSGSGSIAPFVFWDPNTAQTDPNEGRDNIIANNIFAISSGDGFAACDDGTCASGEVAGHLAKNSVWGNLTFGADRGSITYDGNILLRGSRQLRFTDAAGDDACISIETTDNRLFHNTDCDDPAVKDAGEEYIDFTGTAAGADPILIDGSGITDSSGVDFIGGTNGVDFSLNTGVTPDTATINLDFSELGSTEEGQLEALIEARAFDADADGNNEFLTNVSAGTGNCPAGGPACMCLNTDDDGTTTDDICFFESGFKAVSSTTPTHSFDDSVDGDTTAESQMVCDANAADNGKCEIQVEDADGVYQAGLQVQSSSGTVSARLGLSGGPSLTCTESGGCVAVGEVTIPALGAEFTAGDVHASCAAFPNPGGGIYFDNSENKFKKCTNGTTSDMDTQSSGGVSTIEEGDVSQLGASAVTIDFLDADFDVADAGAGEADVSLPTGITRDTEWDSAAEINAATTDANFIRTDDTNTVTSAMIATEVRSMHWGAGAMSADGTDCANPAEVSVASGPKFYSATCAMASSETDGFLYGNTVLPDAINISADVTMEITARVVTDNAGATAHGYIEIQCVPADGTVGSTWSSGVDLDITQAAGDVADDLLQDTSAAVDLAQGGNPDCVGGDVLFWRWKLCDTDATPSTGCTSSAGAENDHQVVAMKMEYTTDIGD